MRPEGCGQSLQRRIEGVQHVRSHTAVARHSFTRLTNSCNSVLQTLESTDAALWRFRSVDVCEAGVKWGDTVKGYLTQSLG